MDIRDVYYVKGYINENGEYEKKSDCISIIAECKEENVSGISYYVFRSKKESTKEESDRDIIKVKNLDDLIDVDIINIKEQNEQEFKKLKAYFTIILENLDASKESNKSITKLF